MFKAAFSYLCSAAFQPIILSRSFMDVYLLLSRCPLSPSFHLIRSAQCFNLNQSSFCSFIVSICSVFPATLVAIVCPLCVYTDTIFEHTHTHLDTPKSIEARLHHHRLHLRRRCLRLRGVGGALAIKSQSMHTHTNVVVVLTD